MVFSENSQILSCNGHFLDEYQKFGTSLYIKYLLNVGYELKHILKNFQALYMRHLLDILSFHIENLHILLLRDSYNRRDIKFIFNIALGLQNCFYFSKL